MQIKASKGSARFEHNGEAFVVTFHRTLRLPEDGRMHALPPSLGHFPVKLVDDYKDRVPKSWVGHGGVFIPLHQREAMWLGFDGRTCAVKVATGKVNAVNGKPWAPELVPGVEDYMVGPSPQQWIDGFNAGTGMIKQFVAMPLGMGYTVEGQVTGKEEFGGLQLLVIPPKPDKLRPPPRILRSHSMKLGSAGGQSFSSSGGDDDFSRGMNSAVYSAHAQHDGEATMDFMAQEQCREMGLGAGGQMVQKIYPDPHGIDTWDQANAGRLFVHIVNAEMYEQITGEKAPPMPAGAKNYKGPWFNVADQGAEDIAASHTLGKAIKTVGEKDKEHGFTGQQDDSPVSESSTVTLPHAADTVRDGDW